jgi:hypothetical protein
VGEAGVVDSQAVQERGVQVAHRHAVAGDVVAELIRRPAQQRMALPAWQLAKTSPTGNSIRRM